jgi:hypothetical protein
VTRAVVGNRHNGRREAAAVRRRRQHRRLEDQHDSDGDSVADLVVALMLQGPTPLGGGDFILWTARGIAHPPVAGGADVKNAGDRLKSRVQ